MLCFNISYSIGYILHNNNIVTKFMNFKYNIYNTIIIKKTINSKQYQIINYTINELELRFMNIFKM